MLGLVVLLYSLAYNLALSTDFQSAFSVSSGRPLMNNSIPTLANDLLRVPGTSLHRQLYLVLREAVLNGVWPDGAPIPTEEALRQQYGVSRVTVRRALTDLAAQGLVERRHGLGTFVIGGATAPRRSTNLGMVEELRLSHSEAQVQVVDVKLEVAPPEVARVLQLSPGEKAVHALRLRHIGGTPVMLTDTWVPQRLGRTLTAANLKKKPMYELLMAQGVVFGRVLQEFSAEAAAPQRARLLETDVSAPIMKLVRLLHDLDGKPVQYITVYTSPERTRVLMDIPGDSMNTLSAGQFVHDGVEMRRAARTGVQIRQDRRRR
jgi:GntR family transcriptional regulator